MGFVFLSLPLGVFAAPATIITYENSLLGVINSVVTFLVSCAVAYFFWGLTVFVRSADNADVREDAKGRMMYGIAAITVMVSLWGLVGFLSNTLKLDTTHKTNYTDTLIPKKK